MKTKNKKETLFTMMNTNDPNTKKKEKKKKSSGRVLREVKSSKMDEHCVEPQTWTNQRVC